MDTSQWLAQEFVVKPLAEIVVTSSSSCALKAAPTIERKPRTHKEQALNCPRCNSTNTKFCYYNNYSLTQPRYFCKTCRRYWTEGGSLRNIPVGGGSRKNKRSSSSSSSSSSKKLPDLVNPSAGKVVPGDQDLNLGFPTISKLIQTPADMEKSTVNIDGSGQVSALELLSGITSSSSRGLTDSFFPMSIPDPAALYGSGFAFPDFKPSLSFSLDLIGNSSGFRSLHPDMHDSGGGRVLFPFEDLKAVSGDVDHDQQSKEPGDPTSGYWTTGMSGGGSW